MSISTHQSYIHTTVLKRETIESIIPTERLIKSLEDENCNEIIVVDGTLGGGGHAQYLVEHLSSNPLFQKFKLILVGIDRDSLAIEKSTGTLNSMKEKYRNFEFFLYQENFSQVKTILDKNFPSQKIHGIYADLGVSSPQLDNRERGFSFLQEGPVDMRMDTSQELTAKEVLLTYSESELTRIFFDYGEEPKSRKLAKAIVMDRKLGSLPLENSKFLADYFRKILSYPPNSRIHPATRAFQALRIEVNRELESLEDLLQSVPSIMHDFGKASFISFHSLEDRLVKHAMRNWQKGKNAKGGDKKQVDFSLPLHIQVYLEENKNTGFGKENPRGGIVPSESECSQNPRARSARLRCFEFGHIAMD